MTKGSIQDLFVNLAAIGFAAIASSFGCHPLIALFVEFVSTNVIRLAINLISKNGVDHEVLNDNRGFVLGNLVASLNLFPLAGALVCMVAFTAEAAVLKEIEAGYSFGQAVLRAAGLRRTNAENQLGAAARRLGRELFRII